MFRLIRVHGVTYGQGATDLSDVTSELEGCVPLVTAGFLRHSPHCLAILDREGMIVFMGDAGLEMLDLGRAGVVGRACWDLWPPDARPAMRQAVTRARLGEVARVRGNGPEAGGLPGDWSVTMTPLRDPANRVVRILSVARRMSAGPVAAS